ncbi:MAG: D-TA family PLP-dependent enzyme [Pirellulaceae bacterium]
MDFFQLANADALPSPCLVVDVDRVQRNIAKMLQMVDGDATRLRPHVKTHKMPGVIELQIDSGITSFKTATLAEAQMVASVGGSDVLIAHQLVGPKIQRFHQLVQQYPDVSFAPIVDDYDIAQQIAGTFAADQKSLAIYVDVDCGMHRTGIPLGAGCDALIQKIDFLDGVKFAGLHVYDGHLHQTAWDERCIAAETIIADVREFLKQYPSAQVVGGGSPTFAVWAKQADCKQADCKQADWQCSPGTPVFWDVGYGRAYPDLEFEIAAALLTRVISKPGDNQICLDIGYKAISSEMPLPDRVVFPEIQDAVLVSHSEEHLVVSTSQADDIAVGKSFLAFPKHICPTVAMHSVAHLVRWGNATEETWPVTARDR